MAGLIARKEWSETPLGAPQEWPAALRTALELALANPFPMLIWWGPDLIQLYNDAYRNLIGVKHPRALGQPARECWQDIWDVIGPGLTSVYGGGPSTFYKDLIIDLNRHGFVEETYFTFSFSPLPDPEAANGIGGVLATVQETTDNVVGERRVMLLRDLALRGAQARSVHEECRLAAATLERYAKDVPFALIYLADKSKKAAHLEAAAGLYMGTKASPISVQLDESDMGPWPLYALAREDVVLIEHLDRVLDEIPKGPWPEPPGSAVIVPIQSGAAHQLAGFLVAGINARTPFDDRIRTFYGLVAAQLASAISNARAYEDEEQRAEERDFLSEASRILAESLDLQTTLANLARLTIPDYADWCQIDLRRTDGRVETAAIVHRDEQKHALAQQFVGRIHLNPNGEGNPQAIRTGRTRLIEDLPPETLADAVDNDEELRVYNELGTRSVVCIPIVAQGRTLGAIGAVYGDSRRRYSSDVVPVLEELGRRAGLAVQNASEFERQHRVATSFQEASLPPALPDVHGVSFDAVYVPSSDEAQVGGDWYDAVRLFDGRVVISIGDVAGSGLDAAVTMGSMRQVIRGIAQVHADPALMLDAADRALRLEHRHQYVTAFVGVFDPVAKTLSFASAGHPPAMLRRPNGRVELLSDGGLPLGLRLGREDAGRIVDVPDGSCLVLYTDGLTEFERNADEGERKLQTLLAGDVICSSERPAEELKRAFLGETPAHDDVAILVVRATGAPVDDAGAPAPQHRWVFDARDADAAQSARREFGDALRARGASPEDIYAAEVVLGELVGNVVRYADGPIDVKVDWTGSAPVLHVLDQGPGFRHIAILPADIYSESGRGLYIVSSLTQDFHVSKRPTGGSHARAVLSLQSQTFQMRSEPGGSLFRSLVE